MTSGKPRVLALARSRPLLVRVQFSFAANLFANTLRSDFMDTLPPDCSRICLIGARDCSGEEAEQSCHPSQPSSKPTLAQILIPGWEISFLPSHIRLWL